jgi:phosphopantothenoylcysteine decarboxylase/phosphopantothenate--cysteine ligase
LLIMAAAVADFRPKQVNTEKIRRSGNLLIECEPTDDIVAEAARIKLNNQRIIGFSLEAGGREGLARDKLVQKKLDLIVYNSLDTLNSSNVSATLFWPDGRAEVLISQSKKAFAQFLIARAGVLFGG